VNDERRRHSKRFDPAEEVGAAATVTRHTDSHTAKGVTLAYVSNGPSGLVRMGRDVEQY